MAHLIDRLPDAANRLHQGHGPAVAEHAVRLVKERLEVADVVHELLEHDEVHGAARDRGISSIGDEAPAFAEVRVLQVEAGREGVGLEVAHPSLKARLRQQPAHPAVAAAQLQRPGDSLFARHVGLDRVDEVDRPRGAGPQVGEVRGGHIAGALPVALLFHRRGDHRRVPLRIPHEHQALLDRVQALRLR